MALNQPGWLDTHTLILINLDLLLNVWNKKISNKCSNVKLLINPPYALKEKDGILQPDAIADTYWFVHTQHRSAWTHELDLRPYMEKF